MTSLFSYLITFFAIAFWFFRALATLFFQLDMDFFAVPLDANIEIAILFATLPCILLVIKRNIIGAAIYLAIYGCYFGTALYEAFISMQTTGINVVNSSNLFSLVLGVLLPLLTFCDILLNKNRSGSGTSKKTDWYYKNSDYDRKLDERADKNQYRL